MRAYRVFVDYSVSFVVDAEEIEDSFGDIKFGILYNDKEFSIRFIKTLDGDFINIDHIIRMIPLSEFEYKKRVMA